MRSVIRLLSVLVLVGTICSGQTRFRSGIFLHHSTGLAIWGPNSSSTSAPQEMAKYNTAHNLSGQDAVTMTELWWPDADDNEWALWHRIFYVMDPGWIDIRPILEANKVVMVKSCFPASDMSGVGSASDTALANWSTKSVTNYKYHWRQILAAMRSHPSNFFVIWTNAPLVSTSDTAASLSNWFCTWAKDTLAKGLDTRFGLFPPNVYVFDFFHKIAGPDGRLPIQYALSSSDSHPNSAGTQLVVPQLVQEVFDAAIRYESIATSTSEVQQMPTATVLGQNYPNPFNPTTTIPLTLFQRASVRLRVFNGLGQAVTTLLDGEMSAGTYAIPWNAAGCASGPYYFRLDMPGFTATKQTMLLR